MRQLREQYETVKGNLTEWEKLGKREDVSQAFQIYQAQRTQALEICQELGYDDKDVLAAFAKDPAGTIAFLRAKQAEGAPQDVNRLVKSQLDKELKPFREERERQISEQASNRYDAEWDRLYKAAYPQGLPEDVASFLYDVTTEMLSYDNDALQRLRAEGKVSDIAKYFNQAKEKLLKVFTAWGTHEQKQATGKPATQQGEKKKPSLEEMIDGSYDFFPKA